MSEYCCEDFDSAVDDEYIMWDTVKKKHTIAVQSIDNSTWKKIESKEENLTKNAYTVDATLMYLNLSFCPFCGVELEED